MSSITRRHSGLGLGLSIVRHLTELHGGTVAVHNNADRGATFTVSLPLAISHGTDGRTAPSTKAGDQPLVGLEGIRVLVVDDEPDALDLVARVLRRCHADVTVAASAAAALDVVQKSRPDVLLSDIAMPGEDGYELIRKIRQLDPPDRPLPAAALTAFARSEDRRRALNAGFQMHLAKPVEPGELTAAVADLASHRHRPLAETSQ